MSFVSERRKLPHEIRYLTRLGGLLMGLPYRPPYIISKPLHIRWRLLTGASPRNRTKLGLSSLVVLRVGDGTFY